MKKKLVVFGLASVLFAYQAQAQSSTTTTTTTINQTTTTPEQVPPVVQPTPVVQPAPVAQATQASKKEESTTYDIPRFYIGARLFGTASSIKAHTVENNNVVVAKATTVLGWGFGGYFGFNLTKNFAIQPEVIYSTLSQKYVDKKLDRRIDVSYVDIPLMLVFNTDISKPVNLNICAGPQLGINVGAKVKGTSQGNTEVVNTKFAVKPTDFGFAYGAGLDFRLANAISLGLGFRGVMGLVDVSKGTDSVIASSTTTDSNGVVTNHTDLVLDKSKVRTYGGYLGLRFNF